MYHFLSPCIQLWMLMVLHGTDAWLAECQSFAHYTHTCLARRKQLVSGKNLHGHVSWIRVHYWLHPWTHFIIFFFNICIIVISSMIFKKEIKEMSNMKIKDIQFCIHAPIKYLLLESINGLGTLLSLRFPWLWWIKKGMSYELWFLVFLFIVYMSLKKYNNGCICLCQQTFYFSWQNH